MCDAPGLQLISTNKVNFAVILEISCQNCERQYTGLDNDIRYITKTISNLKIRDKADIMEKKKL